MLNDDIKKITKKTIRVNSGQPIKLATWVMRSG